MLLVFDVLRIRKQIILEEIMAYDIQCRRCRQYTYASNIVDLLKKHTNVKDKFVCQYCQSDDTFIYRKSNLQEDGEIWERWIKSVIQIDTGIETYSPYIFLTADSEEAQPNGLHFHYYKDTRSKPNGRLKHGHGPGGPPVLDIENLFTILEHLVTSNILKKEKLKLFFDKLLTNETS